jgi:hypothetical protein
MTELFGLPMNTLMWVFGLGLLAVIAWSAFPAPRDCLHLKL